jgi:thiol peroxidase
MSTITLKGNPVHTIGEPPKAGGQAPEFSLVKSDLSEAHLSNYKGKRKVLNVFPSIDTPTCATSVRKFNEKAAALRNTVVLNISADLPFAQARFCAAEGIANVEVLSSFRSGFGKDYKLQLADSPLAGLLARAVLVLDDHDRVVYSELVSEITHEPNYDKALSAL